MSAEEARAWLALVAGVGAVVLVDVVLGLLPPDLAGLLGAAVGYAFWRLIPPPARGGPPRYWRGREFRD